MANWKGSPRRPSRRWPAANELSTDRFGGEGCGSRVAEGRQAQSRGQARKDVKGGGVYVNGKRIDDEQHKLTTSDLMFEKYVLLRRGERNYAVAG